MVAFFIVDFHWRNGQVKENKKELKAEVEILLQLKIKRVNFFMKKMFAINKPAKTEARQREKFNTMFNKAVE